MKATTLHPMEVAKRAGTGGGGSSDLTERVEVLEEKIAGLEEYSTEEVDTGKEWVDGKRIYRKVVSGTEIANWKQFDNYDNVDTIVDSKVILHGDIKSVLSCNRLNSASDTISVLVAENQLQIYVGSNFEATSWDCVVEYTKTE